MQTCPVLMPQAVAEYHAHVYFDPATRPVAAWLREQLATQRARVAQGQSRRPAIQSDGMKYHSATA